MVSFDFDKLKSLDYWFAGAAGSFSDVPVIEKSSEFFSFYVNILVFIFIFGLILKLIPKFSNPKLPVISKLSNWGSNFAWIGFLGMFWFSLRETKIAFFGSRFWLMFGFIWISIIFLLIIRYFLFYFNIERKHFVATSKK
jgi:hypothetical protein